MAAQPTARSFDMYANACSAEPEELRPGVEMKLMALMEVPEPDRFHECHDD